MFQLFYGLWKKDIFFYIMNNSQGEGELLEIGNWNNLKLLIISKQSSDNNWI